MSTPRHFNRPSSLPLTRRTALGGLSAVATALLTLGLAVTSSGALAHEDDDAASYRVSRVYTSTNAPAGNELLVYAHGSDGALTLQASVPTGGTGSGAGLGSQGAVTLSRDGRYVFVVNAQSNTVSAFRLTGNGPQLISQIDSGGLHPISVTEHEGTVYVLNDGGAGNVAGFRHQAGRLTALADSSRPLSAAGGTAPAQVGFSADGDAVVVTEKGTNKVISYRVAANGMLSAPLVTASPGQTPFGFAFSRRNHLVVTEAWGGAAGASTVSSYRFADAAPATPLTVSASVPDLQGAACWVAITPSSRYAFVSNTGSSNVSSYRLGKDGRLTLLQAVAGLTGAGSAPADNATSSDGRHLYVRNGRTFTVSTFTIGGDGALTAGPLLTGLPSSAVGLAAN